MPPSGRLSRRPTHCRPALVLPTPRASTGTRRVVGVDDAARHHMRGDEIDERPQQPGDVAEPFGELAAGEVEAAARANFGLPIERNVVAELGCRDAREEGRIDHPAWNGRSGIGGCTIVSHFLHEQAGRT